MTSQAEELFQYNKSKLLEVPLSYKGDIDKDLIEDIKNSKIVIYTAFTGNYDNLKNPEFIDDNCDYVCFTDNPAVQSDIWKIIPMEESNLDNNRKAKRYKVLPHKYLSQYKYSFWIDSSFKITGSIREYIYKYVKNPMLNIIHDQRTCIYDEAIFSASIARYPTETLIEQIEAYESKGMPHDYGLVSCGITFRQHNNPKIIKIMEDWWSEILKYTNQDQVSFIYSCWKNDFHPSISSEYTWENKYWNKGKGNYHNIEMEDSLTSYNIMKEVKSKELSVSDLNPNEVQLLYNDLSNLLYEENNPVNYFIFRIIVQENKKKYYISKAFERKDKNIVVFDLGFFKNIEKITLMPTKRDNVKCRILSIDTDGESCEVKKSNSIYNSENIQYFLNNIPKYYLSGNFSNASYIKITFSISSMSMNELKIEAANSLKREKNKNNEIKKLKKLNKEIKNSKSWKITKPIRLIKRGIKK